MTEKIEFKFKIMIRAHQVVTLTEDDVRNIALGLEDVDDVPAWMEGEGYVFVDSRFDPERMDYDDFDFRPIDDAWVRLEHALKLAVENKPMRQIVGQITLDGGTVIHPDGSIGRESS